MVLQMTQDDAEEICGIKHAVQAILQTCRVCEGRGVVSAPGGLEMERCRRCHGAKYVVSLSPTAQRILMHLGL